MTILIFCGGLGLFGESIFGTSFNRRVNREYYGYKRRDEESNRRVRIMQRFEEKYCLTMPRILKYEYEAVEWVADHYHMSIYELQQYAVARLSEILPDVNIKETDALVSWVGAAIKIIDDGKIPDITYSPPWGKTMFGRLTSGVYYCFLNQENLEKLCAWAVEEMQKRGVPITLVHKEHSTYPASIPPFDSLIYIDIFEDPIKYAKKYDIDDT